MWPVLLENETFVIGTFSLRCHSISIKLCYWSNAVSIQRIHKSRRSSQDQGRSADAPQGHLSPHDAHTPASPAAPRARKYLRPSVLRDRYTEVSPSNRPWSNITRPRWLERQAYIVLIWISYRSVGTDNLFFSTTYVAFYFTRNYVDVNVLPVWMMGNSINCISCTSQKKCS